MGTSWELETAERSFAAAAVGAMSWPATLDRLSDATGSVGTCLVPVRGRIPDDPHSERLIGLHASYHRDGWVGRDERLRSMPVMLQRGAASEVDFISMDEIDLNPYYQEWLAPHGLRWFCGVKVAFDADLWVLSIQRSIAQGPFSPAEVQQLASLSEKLASAAALARALGFVRAEAALAAFEASGMAVALIDRLGKVFRLNAVAEQMLGEGISVVQGRLVSDRHSATAALDRALRALLWAGASQALLSPTPLPRVGRRPLLAYGVRPPEICRDALAPCKAVVILVDPDARPQPPEAHLQAAFGLSAAEARLAAWLAGGESLRAAADAHGVAYETARAQLKNIFAKMEISRQSELVALLARFRSLG
jgi:DNA-binding CsgD family transcriptional regulator/PAS domain-containing protein